MYSRIKHGSRNVVLAIVDEGVVSYMRVADAAEAFEGERKREREVTVERWKIWLGLRVVTYRTPAQIRRMGV